MMKKLPIFLGLILIGSSFAFLNTGCSKSDSIVPRKVGVIVNSVDEFKQAIASGTKSIIADDLDFNHETITINHDVSLDSLNAQSSLKNVYFNIVIFF